jgi:hypothetical protein
VRRLAHARVLLHADASEGGPDWRDTRIAEAVRVSVRTIERVRQRFVEDGSGAAAQAEPPRGNTDLNNNKQFSGPVASQMPRCAHPYSATVPEGPAARVIGSAALNPLTLEGAHRPSRCGLTSLRRGPRRRVTSHQRWSRRSLHGVGFPPLMSSERNGWFLAHSRR